MASKPKPHAPLRVHEPEIAEALASRIRDRRRKIGMSQSQLADAIGLTPQQVHKYESCATRISIDLLFRLAPALDMTPADLISGLAPPDPRVMTLPPGRHYDMEHARLYADLPEPVKPIINQMVRTIAALPSAA